MELNSLTAISPIDGRYRKQVSQLDEFFSIAEAPLRAVEFAELGWTEETVWS